MSNDGLDIPELTPKQLREFALVTGAILVVLFGLAIPWLFNFAYPLWPWLVAGALASWGLAAPASLRPVYRGWMFFGLLMSKVTTPLVLGLVFYVLFTPVALVMRLAKRDSMQRRFDKAADSYRVSSPPPRREQMERPY